MPREIDTQQMVYAEWVDSEKNSDVLCLFVGESSLSNCIRDNRKDQAGA